MRLIANTNFIFFPLYYRFSLYCNVWHQKKVLSIFVMFPFCSFFHTHTTTTLLRSQRPLAVEMKYLVRMIIFSLVLLLLLSDVALCNVLQN